MPDVITPQGTRLHSSEFRIAEEFNLCLIGRVTSPDCVFELGFDDWHLLPSRFHLHERVPATFLALWRGRQNLAEFQLGQWPIAPKDPDVQGAIARLAHRLINVRPMFRQSPIVSEHQARLVLEETRRAYQRPRPVC